VKDRPCCGPAVLGLANEIFGKKVIMKITEARFS
jgi:hypothetical protein